MKPKIFIIEDEPLIADDIEACIVDAGYESSGICLHAEKALELIEDRNPDLILLDITLNRGQSGIELGMSIKSKFQIPIIFISSHSDKHTISIAKHVEPVGYLVKPIQPHTLISTIEVGYQQFLSNSENNLEDDSIFVKHKGKLIKTLYRDILFAEAYDNYTYIHTKTNKYLISSTLKKVEEKLALKNFKRVHRSFLVNISHVTSIEEGFLFFEKTKVPVGRSYKEAVFKDINTL